MTDFGGSVYLNSALRPRLVGLVDKATGSFVNDATMTAQLYEEDKSTTVGAAVAMSHQTNSKGNYAGTIPAATTALLTANERYFIFIDISGTVVDQRWVPVTAKHRGAL